MALFCIVLSREAHAARPDSNLSASSSAASAEYYRHWPHGQPALFKLKDDLVLAIPPQYQQFWRQGNEIVRAPASPEDIPRTSIVAFSFFLPDFSGYRPDNFTTAFDPNLVEVTTVELADPRQGEPHAPGYFPPNMLERLQGAGMDVSKYRQLYGLKCYRFDPGPQGQSTCFGKRDAETGEDIMLDVYLPPYTPNIVFPIMQAKYFTKRYGGLRIVWRTNAVNFVRWHDIDAQIWKFIDSWNIANQAEAPAAR